MTPAYARTFARHFPHLGNRFKKKSGSTTDYNCIAWAIGEIHRPWWPDAAPEYFWPSDLPPDETIDAFVAAFQKYGGYEICVGAHREWMFQKIAIYVDNRGVPTHAARQTWGGDWHSKIGYNIDLIHKTLFHLAGGLYGSPFCTMRRRWTLRRLKEALVLRIKTSDLAEWLTR
jgi:hypothetical protein